MSALVISEDPGRAAMISEGLREAGHGIIHAATTLHGLARTIETLAADVVVIDLVDPARNLVEHIGHISRLTGRPVALFVDRSDRMTMEAAIEAGISAYVIDGLRKDRVKAIVDMAVARFNAYSRLQGELQSARQALEDRKLVERAKAILQKAERLSEEEAYHRIRRQAMQENRRMGEVARAILRADGAD